MDAKDDLAEGPIHLIVNPALSLNNPNNPTHTAGTTFMGQFIDHDLTFDLTSRLAVVAEPTAIAQQRTPAFDLDSVYGGGPGAGSGTLLPVGREPRARDQAADRARRPLRGSAAAGGRTAIIADPRNDENMMIAGLQAAFLLFHNSVVDLVAARPAAHVRRRLRTGAAAHHLALPVDDRPRVPAAVHRPGAGRRHPAQRRQVLPAVRLAFIPVEFQGAAYRFGHSMVRPSYRANLVGDVNAGGAPFFGMIFDPAGRGPGRSGRPARGRPGAAALHRLADLLRFRPAREPAARRRCGPTSSSTPGSPRRCSTCRSAPSPR